MIIAVGEYRDALFGIVLVLNTLIGIVQEVRSKRALDRLAVLNAPRGRWWSATATEHEVAVKELVLDDLVVLRPGDQISVDGEVLAAVGPRGRRVAAHRRGRPASTRPPATRCCRAASWPPAAARMLATAVGTESYAFKLSADARRFTLVKSELRDGINTDHHVGRLADDPHRGAAHHRPDPLRPRA